MMTIHELLEDKVFKEFFKTKPVMPSTHHSAVPWRVYVQRKVYGPWAKREFKTYTEAFKFLKPYLGKNEDGTWKCHDAAIQSKGIAFDGPAKVVRVVKNGQPVIDRETKKPVLRRVLWTPKLPYDEVRHVWCPYCRRPTVLGWFSSHHAFPKGYKFDASILRCTICGSSERLING